jgi:molecular chaperone GrpE (heat shock protein)
LNSDFSEYSGDWEELEKNNEVVGKEYLEIQKPVANSSKLTTRTWFEDKENDRNFNGQFKPSKNKTNKYKQKYLAWKAENAEMHERILQLEAEKEKWRTRYKGLKQDYKRVFKRLDLVLK